MMKSFKGKIGWAMAVAAVLAIGGGAVFALSIPGFGKGEKVKAANGVVTIPAARIGDGKAHFYRYPEGGRDISFFVVKGADGQFRTAFDSCDVCYREKKGYEQQGDAMLCKNCGKKFAIGRIGPNSTGGCNPSYLPHREAGGNIVIGVEELRSGARFF
jgi:uncharacterized membrane protein